MRHRVFGRRLKRDSDHRKALLRNLASSLILNGELETTEIKAKFVRPFIEKLVTRAKVQNFTNISKVRKSITSQIVVRKLFEEAGSKFLNRPGGYTRIVKLDFRKGDRAPMARIEWAVDKPVPQAITQKPKAKKKKEENA